jgi:hypothetical protein
MNSQLSFSLTANGIPNPMGWAPVAYTEASTTVLQNCETPYRRCFHRIRVAADFASRRARAYRHETRYWRGFGVYRRRLDDDCL